MSDVILINSFFDSFISFLDLIYCFFCCVMTPAFEFDEADGYVWSSPLVGTGIGEADCITTTWLRDVGLGFFEEGIVKVITVIG